MGAPLATPPRDRREELLDAADRAVRREGPGVSMTTIAAEAGVTKPILYRRFGDKAGLYRALAERHINQLLADLRAALASSRDRRSLTAATIDTYLRMLEERPEVYRFLMHRAAGEDPDVRRQVAAFVRRLGDELARGIAVQLGRPAGDPESRAWGQAMVGMVQAAGDWWLDERPVSREQLVAALVDLLWGRFAR